MDAHLDDGDMLRVAQGCHDSFERIVCRYRSDLVDWLKTKVGSHDAEDVCQEVFLRVFTRASTYSASGSFRGWLYTLAHNLITDRRRVSRRTGDRFVLAAVVGYETMDECVGGEDPAVVAEHRDMLRFVDVALRGVPRCQSELLYEYAEGASCPEMAESRGESINTIKSRMRLARLHLQSCVSECVGAS